MANGDIPVEGSAVGIGGSGPSFRITAQNFVEDGKNFLLISMTPGKKLHIFVDTDTTSTGSKKFDEDVDNANWTLKISEI